MSEGRRGNEIFDVKFYKNDNIDLQNAYGNDLKKYYYHYLTYGLTEGRQASENFDVKSYRFRYTKLQKKHMEVIINYVQVITLVLVRQKDLMLHH